MKQKASYISHLITFFMITKQKPVAKYDVSVELTQ